MVIGYKTLCFNQTSETYTKDLVHILVLLFYLCCTVEPSVTVLP